MKTILLPGRIVYTSSGAVNWMLFLPLLLLAAIVSGALAVFMHLLFRWGHYYILIVSVLCALAVGGMGILAVSRGHCRSPVLAATFGILLGLLLYLGFYYVGMIDDLGAKYAGRFDLFPRYLRVRKQAEVTQDAHSPIDDDRRPHRPTTGNTVMNWLTFGGELAFVLALTTGFMYRRARKPYCEICKSWMTRGLTRFETDKAPALVEALQSNSPQALATLFAAPEYPSVPNTTVAVDYCPSLKQAALRDCPTFVSVKSIAANPQGATIDSFESSKGSLLVRSVQLTPTELPALLSRFPMFQALTGLTPAIALQQLGVKPEPPREKPVVVADIKTVPPEFVGRVLTAKTKWICAGIAFGALFAMFAGIGLLAWGATIALPDAKSKRTATPTEKIVGTSMMVVGGLSFLGIGATFFIDPSWLSNRYLLGRVKTEFARRGSHLVAPTDPQATFVEIVPKINWGKLKLENASDVGLLRLDKERREILFEGDNEYCRVPVAAVTSCEVEVFVEGQGSHAATPIYYTVVRAQQPSGLWEAPIRKRGSTGKFAAKKRKRWAEELRAEILQMRGASPAPTIPSHGRPLMPPSMA